MGFAIVLQFFLQPNPERIEKKIHQAHSHLQKFKENLEDLPISKTPSYFEFYIESPVSIWWSRDWHKYNLPDFLLSQEGELLMHRDQYLIGYAFDNYKGNNALMKALFPLPDSVNGAKITYRKKEGSKSNLNNWHSLDLGAGNIALQYQYYQSGNWHGFPLSLLYLSLLLAMVIGFKEALAYAAKGEQKQGLTTIIALGVLLTLVPQFLPISKSLFPLLMLLGILLFTEKYIPYKSFAQMPDKSKILWVSLNYSVLILGLFSLLIFSRKASNPIDLSSIIQLLLLLLCYFIFSVKILLAQREMNLPIALQYVTIGIAALFLLILMAASGSVQLFFPFLLGTIIYLLSLELYIDTTKKTISWFILWLIIASVFSSLSLSYFFEKEKSLEKYQWVQSMAKGQDSLLNASGLEITENPLFSSPLLNFEKCALSPKQQAAIDNALENPSYLRDNYHIQITKHGFLESSTCHHTNCNFQPGDWESTYDVIGSLTLPTQNPECPCLLLEFRLLRKPLNSYFANGDDLYAVYHNLKLIYSNSSYFEKTLPDSLTPQDFTFQTAPFSQKKVFIHQEEKTIALLIGPALEGIKAVSLFSYIFTLSVFLFSALLFLNHKFNFLPNYLKFEILNTHTLRYKLQVSMLSIIFFSFVLIAAITGYYLNHSSNEYNNKILKNQAFLVKETVEDAASFSKINPTKIQELLKVAQYSGLTFEIFDKKGNRVFPESNAYSQQKIDYKTYRRLQSTHGSKGALDSKEGIYHLPVFAAAGQLEYIVSTKPLGENPPPFDNKSFLSALLNVYVFLLLFASLLAIAVANSVSKPLQALVEKLKTFRLGKTNPSIQWENNDELGMLIHQYNELVQKLDESAQLLAQTEREVAWREMAKQVAHEIKNPLTPMKLSIQYLQLSINKEEDELRDLIQKTSNTLVEQIENLSHIASEFSNFAKLPQAENEALVLNDLVASVHELFRKSGDIRFNLYISLDEIKVFADKSHLLRVFNNLLKNAIQSIPGGRKGEITIKLSREEEMAVVKIKDNGQGIPAEMHAKVFYPNFTTKTSGTGLGLPICKSIIESFGGKIYFDTLVNVGTTFTIELPLHSKNPMQNM